MGRRTLTMPPDVVIRPAGIWDSRAPFNDFLDEHRRSVRHYNILTLAASRLVKDAENPATALRGAKKWLKVTRGSAQAGRSWMAYRRSLPRTDRDQLPSPSAREAAQDLDECLTNVRKGTLIMYSSAFEIFVQCWALNYLLARLDAGFPWTGKERALARDFSPVHGSRDKPGFPRIVQSIPVLSDGLPRLPTFVTSPDTDSETPASIEPEYNALEGIRFWRAVRNHFVHRDGIIDAEFGRRHSGFIVKLREHYPYMPPVRDWTRFLLYDDLFRAMLVVHYRVARWMSDELESMTLGRRGHPLAPGPKSESFFPGAAPVSPKMIMVGDHEASFRWLGEPAFRAALRARA